MMMVEYLEDYNFTLQYHPKKANVVVDELSCKPRDNLGILTLQDWKRPVVVEDHDLQYYEDGDIAFVYNVVAILSLLHGKPKRLSGKMQS